jgi:hypothetical protein
MKPSAVCRRLVTRWCSWVVTGETEMRLDLPPHDCTDMTGCIEVAKFLMPDVTKISVYAGGKPDIIYEIGSGGEWEAFNTRKLGK